MGVKITNLNLKPYVMIFRALALCGVYALSVMHAVAIQNNRQMLVRDITTIEGVRDNPLVGYGLVVGLHGTGDSQQTIFTVQTLANAEDGSADSTEHVCGKKRSRCIHYGYPSAVCQTWRETRRYRGLCR
jgi:Flagellar P-ring protein